MNPIDWTKPAAEVLADLLVPVWVPTNAEVTIGMIRDSIGLTPQEYGLVRSTLEGAIATLRADADPAKRMQGIDLHDALSAMLSRGISLSSPDRQATIDLLAAFGQWPDSVRDAVKAVGGVWVGRWSLEGFETVPTVDQVTARKSLEATKVKWSAVQGLVEDRLHTGTITQQQIAWLNQFPVEAAG
jgi:hypothetical protein